MAKLIEILARELEQWPKGAAYAYQDKDTFVKFTTKQLKLDHDSVFWTTCGLDRPEEIYIDFGNSGGFYVKELSATYAEGPVREQEWRKARAAYLVEQCPGALMIDETGLVAAHPNLYEWQEWKGGEQPVGDDVMVDIKLFDSIGELDGIQKVRARYVSWQSRYIKVTHWRLHKPDRNKQNHGTVSSAESKTPALDPSEIAEQNERVLSPQEAAFLKKQSEAEAVEAQHKINEALRRKSLATNLTRISNPHAMQLGMSQYD